MPTEITIPISTIEVTVRYEKPNLRLIADRIEALQALFDALAPWHVEIDDLELITVGKVTEQGVRLRIASQKASFFFGATYCKFVKDGANWSEADEIMLLFETALKALAEAGGMTFGKRISILSLHLQLKVDPYKNLLRSFMSSDLLNLDSLTPEIMATVIRWPKHRITLDGSAAIANAIFLQLEREFDVAASFDDMKKQIYDDEVAVFKLLGVEEVES